MTASRGDVRTLLSYIQDDLRGIQGKLIELRAQLATMSLPDAKEPVVCPHCDLPFEGPRTLAEHTYLQHDGPQPAHWLAAQEMADV